MTLINRLAVTYTFHLDEYNSLSLNIPESTFNA